MADAIDDGGPAVSLDLSGSTWVDHEGNHRFGLSNEDSVAGLTVRDYFAAAALTGLCAQRDSLRASMPNIVEALVRQHAILAYEVADAMMAARKRTA